MNAFGVYGGRVEVGGRDGAPAAAEEPGNPARGGFLRLPLQVVIGDVALDAILAEGHQSAVWLGRQHPLQPGVGHQPEDQRHSGRHRHRRCQPGSKDEGERPAAAEPNRGEAGEV